MLIAMVSIFVCCWLPLNVIILTSEYLNHLYHSPYFLLTFFSAHVVAMSSTVYNPFLYRWRLRDLVYGGYMVRSDSRRTLRTVDSNELEIWKFLIRATFKDYNPFLYG